MANLELDDDSTITNFYQEWASYLNNSGNPDLPDEAKEYIQANPYIPSNVEKEKDKLLVKSAFNEIEVKVSALLSDVPQSSDIPSDQDIWNVFLNKINSGSILIVPNPDYPGTSTNQFIFQIAP